MCCRPRALRNMQLERRIGLVTSLTAADFEAQLVDERPGEIVDRGEHVSVWALERPRPHVALTIRGRSGARSDGADRSRRGRTRRARSRHPPAGRLPRGRDVRPSGRRMPASGSSIRRICARLLTTSYVRPSATSLAVRVGAQVLKRQDADDRRGIGQVLHVTRAASVAATAASTARRRRVTRVNARRAAASASAVWNRRSGRGSVRGR